MAFWLWTVVHSGTECVYSSSRAKEQDRHPCTYTSLVFLVFLKLSYKHQFVGNLPSSHIPRKEHPLRRPCVVGGTCLMCACQQCNEHASPPSPNIFLSPDAAEDTLSRAPVCVKACIHGNRRNVSVECHNHLPSSPNAVCME